MSTHEYLGLYADHQLVRRVDCSEMSVFSPLATQLHKQWRSQDTVNARAKHEHTRTHVESGYQAHIRYLAHTAY